MLLHSSLRPVQTILYGMANAAEALEFRRIKAEEIRLFGGFNDERVREVDHSKGSYRFLMPAAFKMAWQVPVGTSLAP